MDQGQGFRREGRDVNQRLDLLVIAGFADHDTAPGVADQHGGTVLGIDRGLGGGDIVRQRGQRVGDLGDVVALGREDRGDLVPAGFIGESAVDEHDILCGVLSKSGGSGAERSGGEQQG